MFFTHDTDQLGSAGKPRLHFTDTWFWVTAFSNFLEILEKKLKKKETNKKLLVTASEEAKK